MGQLAGGRSCGCGCHGSSSTDEITLLIGMDDIHHQMVVMCGALTLIMVLGLVIFEDANLVYHFL